MSGFKSKGPASLTIYRQSCQLAPVIHVSIIPALFTSFIQTKANLFTALASIHNIHVMHDVCAKMRDLILVS